MGDNPGKEAAIERLGEGITADDGQLARVGSADGFTARVRRCRRQSIAQLLRVQPELLSD